MAKKADVQNRLKDALHGIKPGGVDLNPEEREKKPPPPDISELGLPSAVSKALRLKVARHVELGQYIKERKQLSKEIAELMQENIGASDEFPCIVIADAKVSRYDTERKSIKRDKLLALGVSAVVIAKATVKSTVHNCRITPPGGKDEEDDE